MPDAAPQLSDADLINQFILGTLPGMQQQAAPTAQQQPFNLSETSHQQYKNGEDTNFQPKAIQQSFTSTQDPAYQAWLTARQSGNQQTLQDFIANDQGTPGTPNLSLTTGQAAQTGIDKLGAVGKTAPPSAIPPEGTPAPQVTQAQLSGAAPMPAPQAPAAATPPAGVDPAAMIKFYSDGLQTLKSVPASEYTIGLQKTYADELSKWQGILQQQPGFQGQVAQSKAIGTNLLQQDANGNLVPLPGAIPSAAEKAGAIAKAEAPSKLVVGRPGTLIYNGLGQVVGATPELKEVVDPQSGQKTYQYTMPPGAPSGLKPPAEGPNAGPWMAAPPPPDAANPTAPPTVPLPGAPPPVAPGQQAQVGDIGGSVAGLGPGTIEALQTRAKEEQEQRQKVINDATSAQTLQAQLQNMQNDMGNFTQGPLAEKTQQAASYLRLIDPNYNGQVASYEDFVKNAGALTRNAVHDTSSRASQQEYQMIQNTLPNPDMSPQGLTMVTNELMGLNDYKTIKAQAQAAWEQAHGGIGNVSGFETDFQNKLTPYAFVVLRMDPQDRQNLVTKLQAKPGGQQVLNKLGAQLQYLKSSGLDQQIQ